MATKAQKQHAIELKKELWESGKIPVFEIEIEGGGNKGYYLYDIKIDTRKATINAMYTDISIDIGDYSSLDEHLEALYDKCYNNALNEFLEEFLS